MRVLLIQPPLEDFYITSQRLQPTGLLHLASFLKDRGHAVEVLDLLAPSKKTKIPLDDDLKYLEELLKDHPAPDLFGSYYRFGAIREKAEEAIGRCSFDVCGISANFAAYFKTAVETAEIVRKIRPSAFVVVGGNSVPVCFRAYLESGFVDAAVFGEGENTMASLLDCMGTDKALKNVANIAFLDDGSVRENSRAKNFDIEKSSFSLDFVDPDDYRIGRRRSLSLVTSRGCPLECSYCTANLNCLSGHQRRTLDAVWRDIENAVERHKIEALNIEDENFTRDKKYALEFLSRKTGKFPDLRLYCMNGLDYRTLDDELLAALRKADLLNLGLALVDMDPENEELLRRPASVRKFKSVVDKAKELGFLVTVYFIAGLPGQTRKSLEDLLDFLSTLSVVVGMSVYYAVPGTRLFEQHKDVFEGLTFTRMRSTALWTGSETLSQPDLIALFNRVREMNRRQDN